LSARAVLRPCSLPALHAWFALCDHGGMTWDQDLSRPLLLKDGKRLETLRDVRRLFLERFATVTHNAVIAYAEELLLKAATTGKHTDIAAATDQVESVLMRERLMQ
jgi:hypothetical protein